MAGTGGGGGDAGEPVRVVGLKRRSEFLAVAGQGRRWVTPAFVLQAGRRRARRDGDAAAGAGPAREIGLGFTASRRVGKAVARNRARRRLREAVRRVLPGPARPGFDYVVVARPAVLTRPFAALVEDLRTAFERAPSARPREGRAPSGRQDGRPGRGRRAPAGVDSAPGAAHM